MQIEYGYAALERHIYCLVVPKHGLIIVSSCCSSANVMPMLNSLISFGHSTGLLGGVFRIGYNLPKTDLILIICCFYFIHNRYRICLWNFRLRCFIRARNRVHGSTSFQGAELSENVIKFWVSRSRYSSLSRRRFTRNYRNVLEKPFIIQLVIRR